MATAHLVAAASIVAHEGNLERAAELLALAETQYQGSCGILCPRYENLCEEIKAELGAEKHAAAHARGTALELDTLVAEFLDGSA